MDGGLSLSSFLHGLGDVRSGQLTSALTTIWYIIQIIASISVLIVEWEHACDQRLNLWLTVSTCRVILRLALSSIALTLATTAWGRVRQFLPSSSSVVLASLPTSFASPSSGEAAAAAAAATTRSDRQDSRSHRNRIIISNHNGNGVEQEGEGDEGGRRRTSEEQARRQQRREARRQRRLFLHTPIIPSSPSRPRIILNSNLTPSPPPRPPMVVEKAREILDILALIWFTLGNAWVFGSRSCRFTSPGIFYVSLAIIIVTYVSMLFPVLLAVLFVPLACFCMPCFLRLALQVRAQDGNTRGASRTEIDALPTVIYREGMFDGEGGNGGTCAICLTEYEEEETLRMLQCPGKHHFHVACVDQWLR